MNADRELANVGNVSTDALAKVLKSVQAHPGGYDVVRVCVYTDGTADIQATTGVQVTAPIDFEYPWKPEPAR